MPTLPGTAPCRRSPDRSFPGPVVPDRRPSGTEACNSDCGKRLLEQRLREHPSSASNCRFVSSPPPNPRGRRRSPPPGGRAPPRAAGWTPWRPPPPAPLRPADPGSQLPVPDDRPVGHPGRQLAEHLAGKPAVSDQSSSRPKSRSSPAKYAASLRIGSASRAEPGASTCSAPSRVRSRASAASRTSGRAWKATVTRPAGVAASSSGPTALATTDHSTAGSPPGP